MNQNHHEHLMATLVLQMEEVLRKSLRIVISTVNVHHMASLPTVAPAL